MKKILTKFSNTKLGKKTKKGIDGLIVAVAIILIAMALALLFKNVMQPRMEKNINNAATQIDELNK